ncbi:MAG: hypothetical protein JNL64_03285 [Blastocatellia bacterium]|jgi:hypothetical protein|nr:hypothetical protein [Blastocatellia bacterium]
MSQVKNLNSPTATGPLLVGLVTGLVIAAVFVFALDITWQNRFPLYNVRNQLYRGIARQEVDRIVEKNCGWNVKVIRSEQTQLVMYAKVGFMADSITLTMDFADDRLVSAKIVGEDHPLDIPRDAPPDLLPQ